MRTARHILLTLLVLTLLLSGLPLTVPEDANHDERVDLEDAILCVGNLVRTAETPGPFSYEAETALLALYNVARLKKSIGPVNETKSKSTSLTPAGFYLVPSLNTPYHELDSFPLFENCVSYESLPLEPPTPPPEKGCSSFAVRSA
jgi:hypothetical protein